jgi:putative nucleotidyltransferase with HDIG domain
MDSNIFSLLQSIPMLAAASVHDAYLVGGAVRDMLLGISPIDYDIVVPDDPQALSDAISRNTGASFFKMGKNRQTVLRSHIHAHTIDIVRMAGRSIEIDLRLRDFTINAMALHLNSRLLLDPMKGREDMATRTIRMVSEQAFPNDPLRLLRTYRFAATLNFEIEKETEAAIKTHSQLIRQPAGERIREELIRLLNTPCAAAYLHKMRESGLLFGLFPEIEKASGCSQNAYHRFDVLDHTLSACRHIESILNDMWIEDSAFRTAIPECMKSILKLAVLLHDIGKPQTRSVDANGSVHFIGHEKIGAEISADIASRLKLSNSDADYLSVLIRNHLRPLLLYRAHQNQSLTRKGIIRLFRSLKLHTPDLLLMALADARAKTDKACEEDFSIYGFITDIIKLYFQDYLPQKNQVPLITGHDLISQFGLQPSPAFKIIIDTVEEARLSQTLCDRSEALSLVRAWIADHEKGLEEPKRD